MSDRRDIGSKGLDRFTDRGDETLPASELRKLRAQQQPLRLILPHYGSTTQVDSGGGRICRSRPPETGEMVTHETNDPNDPDRFDFETARKRQYRNSKPRDPMDPFRLYNREPAGRWQTRSECAGMDTSLFHPEVGEDFDEGREVCARCPVRAECLEWALETNERYGLLGGMSPKERRAYRRKWLASKRAGRAS